MGGGSGGNAAKKRRLMSESQEEKKARCEARNELAAACSKKPARLIRKNKRKREKRENNASAQKITHMLLAVLFKTIAVAAMLAEHQTEIDTFLIAVHHASTIAADQGKVMAVQVQFAPSGSQAIENECRGRAWPGILSAFGQECGLREACHVRSEEHTSELQSR